ncbi:MAG: hypothetical protein ACTHNQ_04540 [Microbacterium sp.]|uniref:hypothetical protein n=1 Tax=Microbacterium sp. TaxID=51671 RepID=UPI003F810093
MSAQPAPRHPSPDDAPRAAIRVRRARDGDLVDAYPAGSHDQELLVTGEASAAQLAAAAESALAVDPRCRRVILAVTEGDLDEISRAEDAGFRYVVDVEIRAGGRSLLVREPGWVLAQPHVLDDIPLKE